MPPGLCYQFPVMRNLQAFHIEPDLVVRELPNGAVEIQRGALTDATEVSRDQLPDLITALRAVRGSFPHAEAGFQADAILKYLRGCQGFDGWWDTIVDLDQRTIHDEIAGLLTR